MSANYWILLDEHFDNFYQKLCERIDKTAEEYKKLQTPVDVEKANKKEDLLIELQKSLTNSLDWQVRSYIPSLNMLAAHNCNCQCCRQQQMHMFGGAFTGLFGFR